MSYLRPPVDRVVDPNRMNWLWRQVNNLCRFTPQELVAACAAAGIELPKNRAKAWAYAEDSPDFSAMNVTELERTLAAVAAFRRAQREAATLQEKDS